MKRITMGLSMRRRTSSPGHRAFTLVEMLIVIGIILLLTALTAMVTVGFRRASEVRVTEDILKLLEASLSEWELVAERKISYGEGDNFDIDREHIEGDIAPGDRSSAHFDDTILELIAILNASKQSRELLANIDSEFLRDLPDPDGGGPDDVILGVRDSWDTTLRVVFPGLVVSPQEDQDGTARTLLENVHGIALNRRVYFVSAGPDGKFGDLHLEVANDDLTPAQRLETELAQDNVYSYEVLMTRPQP